MMKRNIAIIDDHRLVVSSLKHYLGDFDMFDKIEGFSSAEEFIDTYMLNAVDLPDVVLLDINMPDMDGCEALEKLNQLWGDLKVIVLSMYDNEGIILRMLKLGARAYLLKGTDVKELVEAISTVIQKGYYYNDRISSCLMGSIKHLKGKFPEKVDLRDREIEFLKMLCTEMTYKEIAEVMCLSPKTIDGYREGLFEKLKVRSRTGLVVYAIKNGYFILNS